MRDQIILSTGIFEEIPVSFCIAYKEGRPVYVDFPDANPSGCTLVGRIDRISRRPAGAFVRLKDRRTGFLERKYFDSLTFETKRPGIDRTLHPLIDGDRVFLKEVSQGKYAKKTVLAPALPTDKPDDRITAIAETYGLANAPVIDAREDEALKRELMLTLKTKSTIDNLLSAKVFLKDGSSLRIEENETAVLIDINSSKNNKGAVSALSINCSALDAIFEQICLRHLSGMILVDFLKMPRGEEAILEEEIRKRLAGKKDLFYHDITALGIGEFTAPFHELSLRQKMAEIRKKASNPVDES